MKSLFMDEDGHTTVLRPGCAGPLLDVRQMWQYRELLWFLGLRDIQVRYKQTLLGAAWAVIQPFVLMIVFSVVFGKMLKVGQSIDVAYPIFAYAGLLPWTFFANAVTASSNALAANSQMLRKIYFPRIMLPISAVGAPLADYVIAFVVLVAMMFWYGVSVSAGMLLIPLLVLSTIIAATGIGVLMSAVTVRYRDFRHIVPFMIQIGLFITPVIYPLKVDSAWHWLLQLNPMSGTISAFRAAVLGTPIDFASWAISLASAVAIGWVALWLFRRNERTFADLI